MDIATVQNEVKSDVSWIQKHERIIIVLFVLLTIAFCFNKYVNYDAAKKDAALSAATVQTQEALKQKEIAAQTVVDDSKKYQEMIATLETENKLLISTIQNDNIVLGERQKKDSTLPLDELSQRWEVLVGPGISEIGQNVNVTPRAAHETVSQLESVPVLKAEVTKQGEIILNKDSLINEGNKVNLDLTKEIKSDTLLLESKEKECKTAVSAVKADDRKSKKNWFLRGVGVGAGVVLYITIHFI
jgi:hypothetical protein